LIQGIISANLLGKPADNLLALSLLKAALDFFRPERLPQRQRTGEAFCWVGTILDPHAEIEKGWEPQAMEAYLCAIQLGSHEAVCLNNLANIYYQDLGQHERAEQAYLRAIELDPKYSYPHNGLGNLYQIYLGRYEKAEQAYLKAIELDPKFVHPHTGLGALYQDHLGRYVEAEQAYLKAIELDPKTGGGPRGLAWLCLLHKGDSDLARRYAEEGMAQDPGHPGSPLAVIAATVWTAGWPAAQPLMPDWLAKCPASYLHISRPRVVALFRKIREQGGWPALAEMLRGVEHLAHWKPWSEVVGALASGNGRDHCTTDESRSLYDHLG
jgi:tetratricopeptide (TPR) repeat protein